MGPAERVIVSCLLLDEGADPGHVREFVSALSDGVEAGESDSASMLAAFMERAASRPPSGAAGDVIRVMRAVISLEATFSRFGMACEGLKTAAEAITARPGARGLAARVLLEKATAASR